MRGIGLVPEKRSLSIGTTCCFFHQPQAARETATSLFSDGQAMPTKLIKAKTVFGRWPASQLLEDDLVVPGRRRPA
jgi:hypothetical protein